MTEMTSKEMVDLSREYTFFSWRYNPRLTPSQ